MNIINQISEYERYNIYMLPCKDTSLLEVTNTLENQGVPVINVGQSLAKSLANIKKAKHLHLEAEDQFKKLIETDSKKLSADKPPIVAIFNLGILFEEFISIDAAKIIKELSKSFAIIIIWDEQIESSAILHWGVQKDTIQLNFTDTHLKQVNIPYEI